MQYIESLLLLLFCSVIIKCKPLNEDDLSCLLMSRCTSHVKTLCFNTAWDKNDLGWKTSLVWLGILIYPVPVSILHYRPLYPKVVNLRNISGHLVWGKTWTHGTDLSCWDPTEENPHLCWSEYVCATEWSEMKASFEFWHFLLLVTVADDRGSSSKCVIECRMQ